MRIDRIEQPHVSDAGSFASAGESDLIGLIDLRGADGRDGRDGQSLRTPPRRAGMNGRRGGDASAAVAGQEAASLSLQLAYSGNDRSSGQLWIRGDSRYRSRPYQTYDQAISIGHSGYLHIQGTGGTGGNGGRGGDGQPGSVGSRGRDATRWSPGTSGGPGGNGGNAGNPSDGAGGGAGADVDLLIDEQDTGLLMLVNGNLAAGGIGFAGERAVGGKGGAGGKGGNSCHWTETRGYTDAQGRRQTRIVHRYMPGGRDGRRGRDGASSSYHARDGDPGPCGRLRILVRSGLRTVEYDSPYNLELITFDVAREYQVLEPDSLVSIDNLVVRNCGGMPTPANYTITVDLESDRWLIRDGASLVLEKSLSPGETYTFDSGGLKARLGDYVVEAPRRNSFVLHHDINPHSRMESGISRPFRQFENSQEIDVRFPVEIEAVTALRSLAPGESTRVIWAIENTSDETFDQKYLYRAVKSNLTLLEGDIDFQALAFFDHDDRPADLLAGPLHCPIQDLRPGQTQLIETRVGIKDSVHVTPYQGFSIGIELHLQRPKSSQRSDEYRCVDSRQTFIRVSERYVREKDARFLLIANQRTTVEDIEKWTQLADYFGSSLDVWDVSYYGFLDLVRDVDRDESLLDQWRGMTFIIPNNYYRTPGGKTVAFTQLAKDQFLRAAADYDINFYVVGDSRTGGEDMLQRSLIPVDADESPSGFETRKDFLNAIEDWNEYIRRSEGMVGGASTGDARDFADVSLGAVHEFDINKRTVLFQPDEDWLEKQAKQLAAKLQRDDPLHRWVIVHRYDTGDTDTSWGFFRKRQVGSLEARRTLDATKGSAVLYEVDGIDAIDPEFINSEANKHGIFLALKFEDKVDRFIRLVSERTFPRFSERYIDRPLSDDEVKKIGDELVACILVDVFNEQKVAREAKSWGRGGVDSLMPKLNYLAERSLNYGVTHRQMKDNPIGLDLLCDLIAGIHYIAEASRSIWDSAWIPTSFLRRSRAVSRHLDNRAERILTNIFGRDPSWWDKWSGANDDYDPFGRSRKESTEGIERQIADQEVQSRLDALRAAKTPLDHFSVAQNHPGLTYDPELLPKSGRVMSGVTYDALVETEARAAKLRHETEQLVRAQRSDLLVPLKKPQRTEVETPQSVPTRTPQP